ncbi:Flavorubredoxin [Hathewaya proteolytica DSM 3090]|uniref:Flavorubredoxin n=1 Tax=Hathewaya proteolytica DSM 3090 TaxID=1121331 RepID=A0A1M6K4E6_9CLOT|nr:FprA family A-type flavoprotein [Hathewaya proteolytica]SHJ53801.1 Flavorubredoxin [Hathewaya proteolytica DSM 3090]
MHCIRNIKEDIFYVGASDRRLSLFENTFPIPDGVSYNSYIILDEKNVLMDTVDSSVEKQFMQNLEHVLQGKKLDYVVVNHMEPDHCGTLQNVIEKYPEVKVVGNSKTMCMVKQFFDFDIDSRAIVIKEGDTLSLGKHVLKFFMAPMVHWPEAMVTYDATDKILFSADAFGTFGTLDGNIFDDEVNFKCKWIDEARRYYANIVGKYGVQVQSLLKKVVAFEVEMIAPLHGPIIRENIKYIIGKYDLWSSYRPEESSVLIAYASIYGGTENAANVLAYRLGELGVKNIAVYDVSNTHSSYIVSEAFKYSHAVFAAPTYNNGIFPNMETLLLDLKAHNYSNRTVAIIENGSWGPVSGKHMKEIIESMKNINIIDNTITIKSTVKSLQKDDIDNLADTIVKSLQ